MSDSTVQSQTSVSECDTPEVAPQKKARGQVSQVVINRVLAYGVECLETGNYPEAISSFQSLVETTNDWLFRMFLALAYKKNRSYNSARHELVYVIERCPNARLRTVARNILKELYTSTVA